MRPVRLTLPALLLLLGSCPLPAAQSTFFGSAFNDAPFALLVHPLNGDVYLIGNTQDEIPATPGAWITSRQAVACGMGGAPTICVGMLARFSPDLSTLVAATYLPGNSSPIGSWTGIVADPVSGDLLLAGSAAPSAGSDGAFQPGIGGGQILRLAADLSGPPLAATNYGNVGEHFITGLALHPLNGDVYATGYSLVPSLPGSGKNSAQAGYGGGDNDRFALRFSADLTELKAATFMGGSGSEWGSTDMLAYPGLAIDPVSGEVLLVGGTDSADFPTSAVALQGTQPGDGINGFVTRLDAGLTQMLGSTYLGGSNNWSVLDAVFDPADGALLVAGKAFGAGLPGAGDGAQPTPTGGGSAGFVARLSTALDQASSTYFSADLGTVQRLHALVVEPISGDILAVGNGSGELPGDAGEPVPSPGGAGTFLLRLASNLGAIQRSAWTGPATGLPHALAITPDGARVYTSFSHAGASYAFSAGSAFPVNPGSASAVIFALRSDLGTGLFGDGFEAAAP